MSRRSRSSRGGERERGEQKEGKGGGPPVGTTPKELALRMRKSEDVTSDEYASFHSRAFGRSSFEVLSGDPAARSGKSCEEVLRNVCRNCRGRRLQEVLRTV